MTLDEMRQAVSWAFSVAETEWCCGPTERAATKAELVAVLAVLDEVEHYRRHCICELCGEHGVIRPRDMGDGHTIRLCTPCRREIESGVRDCHSGKVVCG